MHQGEWRRRSFGVVFTVTVAAACTVFPACQPKITPEDLFGKPVAVEQPPVVPDITVPGDFNTIQEAIDAATAGNIILVKPGEYEESLTFKDGLILMGELRETTTVTCDAAAGPVLTVTGCATGKISGLTFAHTGAEALAPDKGDSAEDKTNPATVEHDSTGDNTAATNTDTDKGEGSGEDADPKEAGEDATNKPAPVVLIANSGVSMNECTVRDGAGAGLVVTEGANARVENCLFLSNAGNGILYEGDGSSARFRLNVCKENGGNGIHIRGAAGGNVRDNTCLANACTGIVIADKRATLSVKRNECTGNGLHGLWYPYNAPASVRGNTFVDNAFISKREIGMLWAHGEFADLEAVARRLRKDENRYLSGEWQLHRFYQYLERGWGNVLHKDKEEYLAALADWRREFPKSVTQRVVLAHAHVNWAWDARGGGWASTVTPEGWKGFREHLAQAWDVLSEAEKLNEKDPELYAVWVTVAMGQGKDDINVAQAVVSALMRSGRPTPELHKISQRAMAAHPCYYPTYYSTVTALLPRWGGSEAAVVSFAEQAADATKEQEGDAMYARIAASALGYVGVAEYVEDYSFDWPRMKKGFEDILSKYPDSKFRRNGFCLMACAYKDRETAAGLFAQIQEDDWDSDIWHNEYRFNGHREWAVNDGPYPPLRSPLVEAVEDGNIERARRLVAKGEGINAKDQYGFTALYKAVVRDEVDIVKLLLEAGADPNVGWHGEWSLLKRAVYDENVAITRMLVDHGADVNYQKQEGRAALHVAVDTGETKCLKVLLEVEGSNPDIVAGGGKTPLHQAAAGGNDPAVQALLAHGANLNIRDADGITPAGHARKGGHDSTLALLLEHGGEE
jgi:parallel beta-helix repeat protein